MSTQEQSGVQAAQSQFSPAQEADDLQAYGYWTFYGIHRGDCWIEYGAVYTVFQDGSTRWKCDISSTDSGDEWDGYFRMYNSGGVLLHQTSSYHFDIHDSHVKKRWDETRGPNPELARVFNELSGLTFYCSC